MKDQDGRRNHLPALQRPLHLDPFTGSGRGGELLAQVCLRRIIQPVCRSLQIEKFGVESVLVHELGMGSAVND